MTFLRCSDVSKLEIVAWDGRGQGEGPAGNGGGFPGLGGKSSWFLVLVLPLNQNWGNGGCLSQYLGSLFQGAK